MNNNGRRPLLLHLLVAGSERGHGLLERRWGRGAVVAMRSYDTSWK